MQGMRGKFFPAGKIFKTTHMISIPCLRCIYIQECSVHSLIRLLYSLAQCIYMQERSVHSLITFYTCLHAIFNLHREFLHAGMICIPASMISIPLGMFSIPADAMCVPAGPIWIPEGTIGIPDTRRYLSVIFFTHRRKLLIPARIIVYRDPNSHPIDVWPIDVWPHANWKIVTNNLLAVTDVAITDVAITDVAIIDVAITDVVFSEALGTDLDEVFLFNLNCCPLLLVHSP